MSQPYVKDPGEGDCWPHQLSALWPFNIIFHTVAHSFNKVFLSQIIMFSKSITLGIRVRDFVGLLISVSLYL